MSHVHEASRPHQLRPAESDQTAARPALGTTAERSGSTVPVPAGAADRPLPPPADDGQRRQLAGRSSAFHTRLTPALQIRSRLVSQFLLERLHGLDKKRRITLVLQAVLSISQLVTFITILVRSRHQPCDQPLWIYVIIHTIHLSLSFPCAFYLASAPSRLPQNDEPDSESNQPRTRRLDDRIRIFHDFLCLTTILWFFLGNYFVFESTTCRTTSKELFYASVVILALGYLYLLEVICVVLAVMFYLPVVILGIQLFGWGEQPGPVRPLRKADIKQIPMVVFVPAALSEKEHKGDESAHVKIAIPDPPSRPRVQRPMVTRLARLFVPRDSSSSGHATTTYANAPYPVHPLSPSHSTCAICLADYLPPITEPPEEERWERLRKLPGCQHCFHPECIDAWLTNSARCPLCQSVVRPK